MDTMDTMDTMDSSVGFTLVELLVTVALLGILGAMAVAQFGEYKRKAYDTAALSDLRNAVLALEAVFIDRGRYTWTLSDPEFSYCYPTDPASSKECSHSSNLKNYGFTAISPTTHLIIQARDNFVYSPGELGPYYSVQSIAATPGQDILGTGNYYRICLNSNRAICQPSGRISTEYDFEFE